MEGPARPPGAGAAGRPWRLVLLTLANVLLVLTALALYGGWRFAGLGGLRSAFRERPAAASQPQTAASSPPAAASSPPAAATITYYLVDGPAQAAAVEQGLAQIAEAEAAQGQPAPPAQVLVADSPQAQAVILFAIWSHDDDREADGQPPRLAVVDLRQPSAPAP